MFKFYISVFPEAKQNSFSKNAKLFPVKIDNFLIFSSSISFKLKFLAKFDNLSLFKSSHPIEIKRASSRTENISLDVEVAIK